MKIPPRRLGAARLASFALLAAGLLLTALIDRNDQRAQLALWRAQSVAEAERVGAELRYRVLRERASLVAVATLYSGSTQVTHEELVEAVEVVRRSRGSARLPQVAWLSVEGRRWTVRQSSAHDRLLSEGARLHGPEAVLRTLQLALAGAPALQIGELFEREGRSFLALAVTAPNGGQPGVLLELIAFDELLDQVGAGLLQGGMHLRILHPLAAGVDHARQPALAGTPEAQHRQRIEMGAYPWTLEWAFDRDFNGSPPSERRLWLWLAGVMVSVSLAFAFFKALDQKRRVEIEVRKQRAELETTYAELHAAVQSLAAQERMAALGQLVAGVAHELGTPIGNALLAATTVESRSRETLDELRQGSLRMSALVEQLEASSEGARLVEQNLERASRLLNSFKQVAVDRASERRREFDLRATIEEIATSLGPQLRGTPHRLRIEVPEGLRLQSYPGALGQILSNLVLNALRHGLAEDSPGEIGIRAAALDGEQIRIVCEDSGRGIPEAIRGRIFEPFFTTRLGSGGSGLGLHISQNLARDVLGGGLRCVPCSSGARFELDLPRRAPEPAGLDPTG
ncbi:MAG: HAMP domain-containing histidine kinase [Xanthomonadales bacterium]|nr:HAMP domain-containing histidine kinase [Xanthomonadales bacterium]